MRVHHRRASGLRAGGEGAANPSTRCAGFFLLFLFLFYVLRQSRHPKLRGKPRWWTVETALGSSVFLLLLFTAPGFWYSRHARGARAPGADALTRTHLAR